MLNFFDYTYYPICRFYEKYDNGNPRITALCFLSVFHVLNLMSIYSIFSLVLAHKIFLNSIASAAIYIAVLVYGIRYKRLNYDVLKEKWKNMNDGDKSKKRILIICYYVISLFMTIAFITKNQW
jgi:uncharacterized membrane protein